MGANREGKTVGIKRPLKKSGSYQVIFHVMDYHTDNKQLWVDLIVEGKLDPREIDKKFRIKKEKQYKDIHNGLINTMKSIERQHFSAIRHQNKRVHFTKRGEIRLAALKGKLYGRYKFLPYLNSSI